ncbi:hypothetical protein BSKO_06538 [Bryopsis sp. KO-2023]|nr:hypothetical protein BSKO_06538 [Bryopsis sp. KO-2023]
MHAPQHAPALRNPTQCKHSRRICQSNTSLLTTFPPYPEKAARLAAPRFKLRASADEVSTSEGPYSYNSSDGKAKATIEQVYALQGASTEDAKAPWLMGWQMNERNILWSDDLKLRLIKRITANEMGIPEEEFESRMKTLVDLLPGVSSRLANMPPKLLANLASHVDEIAIKLVHLKEIFPLADVAKMAASQPSLLVSESMKEVQESADRLRELLPNLHVDILVEMYPMMLDIENFEEAIRDAERMLGEINIEQMMARDPSMILSLQKGSNMIPYDEVPTGKSK